MNSLPSFFAPVDHSRLFIAEELTPLFYTPEYCQLPETVRRRYNQLHALYFNEQVTFFEQEMLSPAWQSLLRNSALPIGFRQNLQTFFEEEQQHTVAFRALNVASAPEFYSKKSYHFIRIARLGRALLRALAGCPFAAPLLVWLALLQEERSLYYSKRCLEWAADIEPRFAAVHRAHLADEVGHVGWDEGLLDWLWPRMSGLARAVTARLLGWLVAEFFYLPKRSGARVVGQLAREFPQLDAPALVRAMQQLAGNSEFLCTLYSRRIAPRTFARFDTHPEFALLSRTLAPYPANGAPA